MRITPVVSALYCAFQFGFGGIAKAEPDKKIIAYYIENHSSPNAAVISNRHQRQYPLSKVPTEKITHLNYSFLHPGKVGEDYECLSGEGERLINDDFSVRVEEESTINNESKQS